MRHRQQSTATKAMGTLPHGVGLVVVLLAAFLWSHWPTLTDLVRFWQRNEDYSVGMLVPFVALWLVARQRRNLADVEIAPCYPALGIVLAAELLRLSGLFFGLGSVERAAMVLSLVGIVWLATGTAIVRRLRWVLVFLFLMVPLPARLHELIALPLQRVATGMTVFGLETAGFFVVREGNVIRLDEVTTVAVTEACSGLRMLTAFVFVAAVLAFLVGRPRWQRVVLIALSVPIAVLSNGLRGFVTACFMHYSGSEMANRWIHDVAGWAMMPLALALSLGALKLMDRFKDRAPQPARTPTEPPRRKQKPRAASLRHAEQVA